jgi:hypothetical protein
MKKNEKYDDGLGNLVQLKNPRSGHWTKINRATGKMYSKVSPGPWKGIPKIKKD